jgi:large subunit ribosomal protein L13e
VRSQPGAKKTRRLARAQKATAIAPRPVAGALRPVVRCPTFKHNTKLRAGRGFTLEELRAAKISPKFAQTVGIAVDHRRQNKSEESLQANVKRLLEYKNRLIVFPVHGAKPKSKIESDAATLKAATQLQGAVLPISQPAFREKARAITAEEKKASVFKTIRIARADARLAGVREKRKKDKDSGDNMPAAKTSVEE